MSSYRLKSFKTLYILLSDVIIVQEKGTFDEIFFLPISEITEELM